MAEKVRSGQQLVAFYHFITISIGRRAAERERDGNSRIAEEDGRREAKAESAAGFI
jgi:hypothetical protein